MKAEKFKTAPDLQVVRFIFSTAWDIPVKIISEACLEIQDFEECGPMWPHTMAK